MDITDDLTKVSLRQETILTIGTFDGVHRGHQGLIGAVVQRARDTDRLAALITFHPHPVMVLAPNRAPRYLTTPGEKMALLERLGLDLVVLLPFNREVAATPARDFMAMACQHLRVRELWVGPDFALGRNREGDVPRLQELGRDLGFDLCVFEPVFGGKEAVSSSRIRSLLERGDVLGATELLGRYPSLSGEVVRGAHRGWNLGFPTANLEVRPERSVPANGVYAVFAVLGTERHPAVANVGVRPSFDNGNPTVETHIFDFDENIYGCDLVIEFVARLRDERRFEDIGDLVAQIGLDSQAARQILAEEVQRSGIEIEPAKGNRPVGEACRYRFREVEHTADRALRVCGWELADLFVGAARGMYGLMGDVDGLVAMDWREVRLEAWDREILLVEWLNELLFLTEMEGLLFVDYRIDSLSEPKSPTDPARADPATVSLVARAGAVSAPVTKAHIKAATFHDLVLTEDQHGWSTLITFDV